QPPCSGISLISREHNVSDSSQSRQSPTTACPPSPTNSLVEEESYFTPPPRSPSHASASSSACNSPPPFSSLFASAHPDQHVFTESSASASAPEFAPTQPVDDSIQSAPSSAVVADTKASFSEPKGDGLGKNTDDGEPPPPYTEGYSPLESFTRIEHYYPGPTDWRATNQHPRSGTRFTLSRDELLTLPEFVLLSLFPNGLLPDGHMSGFHEGDIYPVDYDPTSLQFMLDFFRSVAHSIPSTQPSGSTSPDLDAPELMHNPAREMLQDRAGIIVLREDLDFYVIPPRADIGHEEMLEVKRAAGRALLKQNGIFSGLRKSEEVGSTEQHLIEMLTAGGFDRDDAWGHRAPEPNKAVICSLALAKLRTDIRGDIAGSNAVGMAQKLLLFWRKPARRCWWEGVDLDDVEGVHGQVKVWIRRVWTLEMSVIGLR
ncbi:dipeptidyl peptidase 3, partial [Penicillium diatomitis]